MKRLRETVNQELVRAMREDNVTNADLARRMKCSPVTCLLMIQGKRNLQLDTLEKLARALGYRVQVALVKNGNKRSR